MKHTIHHTFFLLTLVLFFSCKKTSVDNDPQDGNCKNNGHTILSEPRLATFQGIVQSIEVNLLALHDGSYLAALILLNGEGWWGGANYKGGRDIWVIKLDANFNVIWKKCFGGSKDEKSLQIKALTNDTYWLACETFSNDGDVGSVGGRGNVQKNLWAFLLNANGNIITKKVMGGSDAESLSDINVVPNGIVLVGSTLSNDYDVTGNHNQGNSSYSDIWTVNLSSTGNIVWAKCYGGSFNDRAYSVAKSSDNNIFIGGSTQSSDGDAAGNPYNSGVIAWLIKTNSVGTILWKKYYSGGGGGGEKILGLSPTLDGGCYWALNSDGSSNDFSAAKGKQDIWIGKVSSTGNLDWKKCIGGTELDGLPPPGYVKPILRSSNDEMLFWGSSGSNDLDFACRGNNPSYYYFWGKIDNTGNYQLINFKKGTSDAEGAICIFEDATSYNLLVIRSDYATSKNYLDIVRYSK
jgi:hypothetical protein